MVLRNFKIYILTHTAVQRSESKEGGGQGATTGAIERPKSF